ncbi:hypothetical protein CLV58_12578 [Spirosoma oryzae]|uniref:Uncharacterized protein n=1 Tax=Spirosoma oryzae TaxID=1469603 RepID=A0A2T0S8V1_9BACT|nr:hypothetical protein [Spirosoma oryzae]PRY29816.1 hypothetical protein CLV58_12578 [Spirosoma oryzae]
MKRFIACLFLFANVAMGQSWGPMLDQQNTMLSQQNNMLTNLTTDGYITLPGNLTTLLGTGTRQQVRNTSIGNAHEIWAGTPDGNQLLTMRGGEFSITVAAAGQVIAIPHGLGYEPKFYMVNVLSPSGYAYTATKTATYLILTIPSQLTLGTTFKGLWLAR